MSESHSVDALLSQVESKQSEKIDAPVAIDPKPEAKASPEPEATTSGDEYSDDDAPAADEGKSSDDSTPQDEYGNSVAQPKMYTEEEVNRMMRERFSRSNFSKDQQQQAQQAQKDGFQFDENSDQSWDQQLEKFVERTVTNLSKKQQEAQWQQQEAVKQQVFEDKFTTGMSKYGDFKEVVGSKPITNAMLMAARDLENPAAFIYAASKQHPQEIERIAKLDNYQQMVEIGRLEERMRKAKAATKASKPIAPVKGDMPDSKNTGKVSIDDRIRQAEKREMNRRQSRR